MDPKYFLTLALMFVVLTGNLLPVMTATELPSENPSKEHTKTTLSAGFTGNTIDPMESKYNCGQANSCRYYPMCCKPPP